MDFSGDPGDVQKREIIIASSESIKWIKLRIAMKSISTRAHGKGKGECAAMFYEITTLFVLMKCVILDL